MSILDLVLVAARFGELGGDGADINGDGVVDLHDLGVGGGGVWVMRQLRLLAARMSLRRSRRRMRGGGWLMLRGLETTNPAVQKGIIALERLLTALTEESRIPAETALLPNYPNPFNPETWIPYQLKTPADVTLTIHDVHGRVVRSLAAGFQPAGVYRSRDRAVYWDGRNERGESVATGVYFCTLAAGDFSATRRMLVNK